MSFQKCPVCDGSGVVYPTGTYNKIDTTCPTCKGTRIINEINGLPPSRPEPKITNSNTFTIDPNIKLGETFTILGNGGCYIVTGSIDVDDVKEEPHREFSTTGNTTITPKFGETFTLNMTHRTKSNLPK